MEKTLRFIIFLIATTFGFTCLAQNQGSLLSTEDYFEQYYSNGVYVPDRNIKVSFYQNAVSIQYYNKGTRDLVGKILMFYYDHTEANGDKVYYNNPNAFLKTKVTIASDGSIKMTGSTFSFIATKGFRDIQSQNNVPSSGNGYYNGGYNNNQQTTYVTCPACNGSGRDQGRIQWYTNGGSRYCATCGTTGLAHDHIYGQCGRCGGTGRVKQY